MTKPNELAQFYRTLARLGPPQEFATFDFAALPQRGVYFFFQASEPRSLSGIGPRVVRVGTHALTAGATSTLKARLRQHRGSLNGGNHRGSIFRSLVGVALSSRHLVPTAPSWGCKNTKYQQKCDELNRSRKQLRFAEKPIENAVSEFMAATRVAVLDCPDEPGPQSTRGYVERNAIALLSSAHRNGFDPASPTWLGRSTGRTLVIEAGLWNQNHTTDQVEPDFVARFGEMVTQHVAGRPPRS